MFGIVLMQQVSEPWGAAQEPRTVMHTTHSGAEGVAGIAGTDEKRQKWASGSFDMTMQVPTAGIP